MHLPTQPLNPLGQQRLQLLLVGGVERGQHLGINVQHSDQLQRQETGRQ